MKQPLLLISLLLLCFSCNTEIPAEEYIPKAKKDCLKSFTKKFLAESATETQKEMFCDCYVNYMIDGQETVSFGSMIKKAKDTEKFAQAIEECKTLAMTELENPPTDSLSIEQGNEIEIETDKPINNEIQNTEE